MNEARIRCGGLIVRDGLVLVEALGFPWRAGRSCGILTRFADAGLPLGFLAMSREADGGRTLAFCIPGAARERGAGICRGLRVDYPETEIVEHPDIAILTLYGPHFYERVGLCSGFHSTLCIAGIEPLAVGSSVNSISAVLPAAAVPRARAVLAERFDWPE